MQVDDAVEDRRLQRRRIGEALLTGEAGDEPGRRSGWGGFVGGLALCLVLALAIAVTAFVAAQRAKGTPPAVGAVAGGGRPAPGTASATARPTPSAAGSPRPTTTGRPAPGGGAPAPTGSRPTGPARTAAPPARTAAPPARTAAPAPPAPAPALAVAATADRRVAAPGELTGVTVQVSSPGGLPTGGTVLVTLPAGTAVDNGAAPMSPGCEAASGQSVRCPLPGPVPAGWRGSYRFGLVSTTQPAAGEDRRGTAVVRSAAGDVSTTFAL